MSFQFLLVRKVSDTTPTDGQCAELLVIGSNNNRRILVEDFCFWQIHLDSVFRHLLSPIVCYRSNCASNAIALGLKSSFLTNSHASRAPCSRSIRLSSHSTLS